MQYPHRSGAVTRNALILGMVTVLLLALGILVLTCASCAPDGRPRMPSASIANNSTSMRLNLEDVRDVIRDFLRNEKTDRVQEFCTRHNVTERTLEGGIRGPKWWLGSWYVSLKPATGENDSENERVLEARLALYDRPQVGPFMTSDGFLLLELEPIGGRYRLVKSSVMWHEDVRETGGDSKERDAYREDRNVSLADARVGSANIELEPLEAAIMSFLRSAKRASVEEACSKYAIGEGTLHGRRQVTWHIGQWLVSHTFPREGEVSKNHLKLSASWGYWGFISGSLDLRIRCAENRCSVLEAQASEVIH